MTTYDHVMIAAMKADGMTYPEIAGRLGHDAKQLRQAHWRFMQRHAESAGRPEQIEGMDVVQKWLRLPEGTVHVKRPKDGLEVDQVGLFWEASRELFEEWQPRKDPPPVTLPKTGGLGVISIYDAHFGMRADPAETGGQAQDLSVISDDFRRVGDGLVSLSRLYDPAEYLIPLGHDFSHVNQYVGKMLTTRNGTEQDVDTRLWKIHLAVCQSAVALIDSVRATGKIVHVVMVPGNHDPDENFKLGQYLAAWYKDDPGVRITNTPTMHKYVGWGDNAFMLTHGEHYLRKNDRSPITIFSAECPPEIWAQGHRGGRWILSGHLHARKEGRYTPTSDVTEEMGIVTYVLPGLTATDDWHYRQGYRHHRAGTLQVFSPSGNLDGRHEITP